MKNSKIRSGSSLLLITIALWISGGCKQGPKPEDTVKDFFAATAACDKNQIRASFTPRLLSKMAAVLKAGANLTGQGLGIDMIDAMCRVYKKPELKILAVKADGDKATVKVNTGKEDIVFMLKKVQGKWKIFSLASQVYRIDEQGLHEVSK